MFVTKVSVDRYGYFSSLGSLESFLKNQGRGMYYITVESVSELHTEEDYRRVYFMFRDALWEADNRGYSKKEFHQMLKKECYMKLLDNQDNFNTHPATLSTKFLSLIGWKRYLDLVKEFAKDEFNIYL